MRCAPGFQVVIRPGRRRTVDEEAGQKFLALELEIAFVNRTDICRQAIKRTFMLNAKNSLATH
jgi:hypothetical protein